eukprot:1194702-Amorphochlora_amoeboformis.AAC.1
MHTCSCAHQFPHHDILFCTTLFPPSSEVGSIRTSEKVLGAAAEISRNLPQGTANGAGLAGTWPRGAGGRCTKLRGSESRL